MALPYNEDAFREEQIVQKNINYPFWNVGERTCRIYTERVNVHLDSYQPLALDTLHSEDKRARLVAESPPEYIDAKVIETVREYATVPGKWSEYVTYNWEVPGIASLEANDWKNAQGWEFWKYHRGDEVARQYYRDVKNYSNWTNPYIGLWADRITMASQDIGNYTVGQTLFAQVTDTGRTVASRWSRANDLPDVQFTSTVTIAAIIGNDLYIPSWEMRKTGYYGWVTWAANRFQNLRIGRNLSRQPRGEAVTARIDHEYFFSRNPEADFVSSPPFRIYDPDQKTIGGVSVTNSATDTITSNTIPDWETYSTWMGKRWLQAEYQKMNRWMGNIWEITTVWVRAI